MIQFQITDQNGEKADVDYEHQEGIGRFALRCLNSGDILATGCAFVEERGHQVALDTFDPYFVEATILREIEAALDEAGGFNA